MPEGTVPLTTKLDSFRPFSSLAARLALGAIMIAHGAMKVLPHGAMAHFCWFVTQLGFPYWMGYVAAYTEFLGGIALVLGILTPVAAIGIAVDMGVALVKVHLHRGLTGSSGLEFPLSLFTLSLVLLADGPGLLSVDSVAFRNR